MLKNRLITGFSLAAILIYILSFAPESFFYPLFGMLVCVFCYLAGVEYASIVWPINTTRDHEVPYPKVSLYHGIVGAIYLSFPVFFISSYYFEEDFTDILYFFIICVFCSLILLMIFLFRKEKNITHFVQHYLFLIAGIIYIAVPCLALIEIGYASLGNHRAALLYLAFSVIYGGDTAAYAIGCSMGKRKLIPSLSPKKTVEGAIGGLIGSAIISVFVCYLFEIELSFFGAITLGLLLGVLGQIGDLFASAIKRAFRVKDSGYFLPGHGGVLDRIDSILTSVPALLVFIYFFS